MIIEFFTIYANVNPLHSMLHVENFGLCNHISFCRCGYKCPLEYLQVYSTTLVFLPFIAMVPTDSKIVTTCLFTFLEIIFIELVYTTLNDHKIYNFLCPNINLAESSLASMFIHFSAYYTVLVNLRKVT